MKVVLASDHAGHHLRTYLRDFLAQKGIELQDLGPETTDSVDYPGFADALCRTLQRGEADWGLLICGSGIGMSIAANRYEGVRAALCREELSARMSRRHNNANVLVLGERFTGLSMAEAIVEAWMDAEFEGGRHERRVNLIDTLAGKDA